MLTKICDNFYVDFEDISFIFAQKDGLVIYSKSMLIGATANTPLEIGFENDNYNDFIEKLDQYLHQMNRPAMINPNLLKPLQEFPEVTNAN